MSIYRSDERNGLTQAVTFWSLRVLAIFVLVTAMLYLIAVVPGAPYHVRELFGSRPSLPQALLFALVVMFALGPPAMLGLQLVRLPARRAWLFPLGILVHAIIVFLGFRYATPIASMHDLLGEPVWGIGDDAERLVRFTGLFVMVSLPISGATAVLYGITRAYAPQRVLWWLGFQLLFLALSYWIVIGNAATDNVVVLLREGARPLAWAGFALWLLCLGFAASLLAERFANVFRGTAATVFALLLFLPLSYGVLFLSLEPNVADARSSLSALNFLLSPSRTDYAVSDVGLFLRYSAAYFVVVLLLACAQYPAWLAYSVRQFRSTQGSSVQPAVGMD